MAYMDFAIRSSVVVLVALAAGGAAAPPLGGGPSLDPGDRHLRRGCRAPVVARLAGLGSTGARQGLNGATVRLRIPVPQRRSSSPLRRPALHAKTWIGARAVVAVWGAGVVVSLTMMAIGIVRLRRQRARAATIADGPWHRIRDEISVRYGLIRPVALLESEGAHTLATWGLWRPQVLLPAQAMTWTAERAAHRPRARARPCQARRLDRAAHRRGSCDRRSGSTRSSGSRAPSCGAKASTRATTSCSKRVSRRPITPRTWWTLPGHAGRCRPAMRRRCPWPGPRPSNGELPPC